MMKIGSMKEALCASFQVQETELDGLSVVTPLSYDDGDPVVVFVSQEAGAYRLDDNGEAAIRMQQNGVALEHGKVQIWLQSLPFTHCVSWDNDAEELFLITRKAGDLARAVMRIAESSIQMQALACLRAERKHSNFKEEVISVLRDIAEDSGVSAHFDVPFDSNNQFMVDALFTSKTPLAVVIATSTERLLEAELIWATRRHNDPTQVVAVIEDINKIGQKQYTRANYYTDKTVQYSGMVESFRDLVSKLTH